MENTDAFRLNWLKTVQLTSAPFLEIKRKQLAALISDNAHLPDQGTDEWLAVRRFNIGGSEMSTITGDGGFSNVKRLIASKAGLVNFTGRLATRWGKMFENCTTLFMENIMEIDGKIQETSSIKGAVSNQRYSPDGLAVIKMLCGTTIGGEYIERYEYVTVLFEFKSPYSGIPNGKIARYYVPQVMTGLCSIPIADFAIFVNNMFRKCSLQNLNETTTYDMHFHNKDDGKFEAEEPIALGLILLYFTEATREKFLKQYQEPEDSDDSDEDSESESDDEQTIDYDHIQSQKKSDDDQLIEDLLAGKKPRDFGKASYYEFDQLMKLFDLGLISVHYCDPLVIQKNVSKIEFMGSQFMPKKQNVEQEIITYKENIDEFAKKENLVGFIPYKLFKSDMIVKHRDPNYLKPHEEKIQSVIQQVRDIVKDTTDMEVIYKNYRKLYPNKDDWTDKEIENSMEAYRNTQSCQHMIPTF